MDFSGAMTAGAPVTPGITQEAFMITTWTFCALSIITMSTRTAIRIHVHKGLQVDDYLLLFASTCLIGATIWTQTQLNNIYRNATLNLNPTPEVIPTSVDELYNIVHREIIYIWAFTTLIWTTIFTAKFAYLWFFRRLVLRMKPLLRYWWIVCIVTALAYISTLVHTFSVCPWPDLRAATCSIGSRAAMVQRFSIAIMVLDIITDVMIVSIPAAVLFKVKIRNSQKIGLAAFLCLSVILASIAIVRVCRLRIKSTYGVETSNGPWLYFWLQIEGCLSICLVSLTAFRSFFVNNERKRKAENNQPAWYSSAIERLKLRRQANADPKNNPLPAIPGGTMTGLRSFFSRADFGKTSMTSTSTRLSDEDTISIHPNNSQIMITKSFRHDVEEVEPYHEKPPTQLQPQSRTFDTSFGTHSSGTQLPSYHSKTSEQGSMP